MAREVEDPNQVIQRRRRRISGSTHQSTQEGQESRESANTAERENSETGKQHNGIAATPQSRSQGETYSRKPVERENSMEGESDNGIEAAPQSAIAVSKQSGETAKRENGIEGELQSGEVELNDQKITLYLSWRLLEKLEDMATTYRRRTHKRIDHNKLMRRLIEQATLDTLLDIPE